MLIINLSHGKFQSIMMSMIMMILQTIFSIASSCCINEGDSNKLGLNEYHGLPKLVANLAGK